MIIIETSKLIET